MTTPSAPTREHPFPRPGAGDVVAGGLAVIWLAGLVHVLRHRIFVTHDSLITYAHVWYISHRLWHDHQVPMAMPLLSHGQAFAFPYGFVPWLTAAIFRPLLGDWVVTILFVLGALALIAITFFAFPELRRGWWAATLLANPALVAALFNGQFPFLWASTMLLGAVACWRRGRRGWATVLVGLAQATHPAVMLPIVGVLAVGLLRSDPDRRDVLRRYALSLMPAIPAAILVVASPVYTESSTLTKVWSLINTIGPRCWIVFIPLVLLWVIHRRPDPRLAGVLFAIVLGSTAIGWIPLGLPRSWDQISRVVDTRMEPYLASPTFHPGDTYRLLRAGDRKVGLYQLLQAGGRADSEFFPESMAKQSWPTEAAYSRSLRDRHVDVVMIWAGHTRFAHTNEEVLLARMAAHPPSRCDGPVVCLEVVAETPLYRAYAVRRS